MVHSCKPLPVVCGLLVFAAVVGVDMDQSALAQGPWPAEVRGFKPPKAGEHPRLFFRKTDLPDIKARARTPEGQAMVARLRWLLDGANGETFPTVFNHFPPVNIGAKGPGQLPHATFTMSHGAGYGFLYQLTGEMKYADLARKSLEKLFDGTPDIDERYTWTSPGAGLRMSMLLVSVAMAYDLAYDGWDDAFRRRVVDEIQNYKRVCVNSGGWEGGKTGLTFDRIVNPFYPPTSNHYGALVGGAAVAILAIENDPGADMGRITKWRADVERNIVRALTQGFGNHGFFAEGPGPSHMASKTALIPALQAMYVAGGKDFINPRPNAQWLTMRWAFEIIPDAKGIPHYPCRNPGAYGTEQVKRSGTSDAAYFSQGFGAIPEASRPALLWTYLNMVEPGETTQYPDLVPKGKRSFDIFRYPHRAVLAFLNFPTDLKPQNPAELLGHHYHDTIHGYLAFRNRWKDGNDSLVTVFLNIGPRGFIRNRDTDVRVWSLGMRSKLPPVTGKLAGFEAAKDGSAILHTETGHSMVIDFSAAAGAECVVVITGPNLKAKDGSATSPDQKSTARTRVLTVGSQQVVVHTTQSGTAPDVRAEGDTIHVGKSAWKLAGGKLQPVK